MTLTAAPSNDRALTIALTYLLKAGARLTPSQLASAYTAASGEANCEANLRALIASQADAGDDLLDRATRDPNVWVRIRACNNAAAPESSVRASVTAEAAQGVLEQYATQSERTLVLAVMTDRAVAEPRRTPRGGAPRFTVSISGRREVADECLWEDIASHLWENPHLAVEDGLRLAVGLLGHLEADLAESTSSHGLDAPWSGSRSILWPQLSSWMRHHPAEALMLAQMSTHPWVAMTAAALAPAGQDLRRRTLRDIVLPALRDGDGTQPVPDVLGAAVLQLQEAADEPLRDALREALRNWNLTHSHSDLSAFVHPRPERKASQIDNLFATGPVSEVLAALKKTRLQPGRKAVELFLRRRDVETDAALTAAGACFNTGLDAHHLVALRPWDRPFAATLYAHAPGALREVHDPDLILAALSMMLTEPGSVDGGGGMTKGRDRVADTTLAALGDRVRELPWIALAQLAGRNETIDAHLLATLEPILADPTALAMFTSLSEAHDGPVAALAAAVTTALAPTAGRLPTS